MRYAIIASLTALNGLAIGDRVKFTEKSGRITILEGVGKIVGFTAHPNNPLVVEREAVTTQQINSAWSDYFPGDNRQLRPFAVSEVVVIEKAPRISGKQGNVIRVDDIAARGPHEFKPGDLIQRVKPSIAPRLHGTMGGVYTVDKVNPDGHPHLKETDHYADKTKFTLAKPAAQINAEKLTTMLLPYGGTSPQPKAVAYRVLSADGKTASSRTWDRYEDALKDATARAERDENFREFQVVSVVTKAKAEKIAVTKYTRGPVVVDKVA